MVTKHRARTKLQAPNCGFQSPSGCDYGTTPRLQYAHEGVKNLRRGREGFALSSITATHGNRARAANRGVKPNAKRTIGQQQFFGFFLPFRRRLTNKQNTWCSSFLSMIDTLASVWGMGGRMGRKVAETARHRSPLFSQLSAADKEYFRVFTGASQHFGVYRANT